MTPKPFGGKEEEEEEKGAPSVIEIEATEAKRELRKRQM